MKKLLSILIAFIMIFIPFCIFAQAEDGAADKQTEFFEDGSYITIEISSVITNENSDVFTKILEFYRKLLEFFTGIKSVSKIKYASYYDKNGNLLWTVFLEAEFSYNRKTSYCKSARTYSEIYDNDWEISFCEHKTDGNRAEAVFTIQQTKLGVKLRNINKTLSLTCDKNGNIS